MAFSLKSFKHFYKAELRLYATKQVTKIDEYFHMVADDGATGMLVLFADSLLHPFPLQIEQCERLLHFASLSDKQPRSIPLAMEQIFKFSFFLMEFQGKLTSFTNVTLIIKLIKIASNWIRIHCFAAIRI